jgi:MFS family permease
MVADAVSYLLSALGIRAIGGEEPHPVREGGAGGTRLRKGDLVEGWRYILTHSTLRPLFFNTILVNGLIMATAPLMAVLMLGRLGFAPWQYGLAFGVPCVGGLVGSRIACRLVVRYGQYRIILVAGVLRVCWPVGLAFVQPGVPGLVLVITLQFVLVTCIGVFNPVYSTYRLEQTASDRIARTLSAWSVTSKVTTAALTALWGVLAQFTGLRVAVAAAGALLLATSLLIPRHDRAQRPEHELAASH